MSSAQGIQSGRLLYSNTNFTSLYQIMKDCTALQAVGETPVLIGMPNVKSDKCAAFGRECVGISKNAKNKKNAYEFIKILLSDTVQSDTRDLLSLDIPINNSSREYKMKLLLQEQVKEGTFTDEQVSQAFDLLTDVNVIKNYSADVSEILWKDMLPFFEDTSSYKECTKKLKNDLAIYIVE